MIRLLVEKSKRLLTVFDGEQVLFCCPVALGKNPTGHKRREGDGRTPEGEYYVCTRNARSKYHLSLGLSYPGPKDAERALAAGEIPREAADAVFSAHLRRVRPPWDTPLGGFIMIHGGGTDGDWTAGCIALCDGDMDVLFAACPLGTEVIIEP